MQVVKLYQIKKSSIEWYFTDEEMESGEQVWFYKDEQAHAEDRRDSLIIVDVLKETDEYYYIIAED